MPTSWSTTTTASSGRGRGAGGCAAGGSARSVLPVHVVVSTEKAVEQDADDLLRASADCPSAMNGWLEANTSIRSAAASSDGGTRSWVRSSPMSSTIGLTELLVDQPRPMPFGWRTLHAERVDEREHAVEAALQDRDQRHQASPQRERMVDRHDRRECGRGSKARSVTARISASLSSKTRKIVPSATSAASAIWRVVTPAPCPSTSGNVALIRPPAAARAASAERARYGRSSHHRR